MRSFDSREINIRMEYRFCPNMILIDTPGLIHAPSGTNLNAEQRAVAAVIFFSNDHRLRRLFFSCYILPNAAVLLLLPGNVFCCVSTCSWPL